MKQSFTPGPWRMLGKIKGNELNAWIFGKDPSDGIERELQVISLQDSHPIKEHLERRLADMKLIASAPSLLEALKECEEYFDKRADVDYADEYIANSEMQLLSMIRETIKNAEK